MRDWVTIWSAQLRGKPAYQKPTSQSYKKQLSAEANFLTSNQPDSSQPNSTEKVCIRFPFLLAKHNLGSTAGMQLGLTVMLATTHQPAQVFPISPILQASLASVYMKTSWGPTLSSITPEVVLKIKNLWDIPILQTKFQLPTPHTYSPCWPKPFHFCTLRENLDHNCGTLHLTSPPRLTQQKSLGLSSATVMLHLSITDLTMKILAKTLFAEKQQLSV